MARVKSTVARFPVVWSTGDDLWAHSNDSICKCCVCVPRCMHWWHIYHWPSQPSTRVNLINNLAHLPRNLYRVGPGSCSVHLQGRTFWGTLLGAKSCPCSEITLANWVCSRNSDVVERARSKSTDNGGSQRAIGGDAIDGNGGAAHG